MPIRGPRTVPSALQAACLKARVGRSVPCNLHPRSYSWHAPACLWIPGHTSLLNICRKQAPQRAPIKPKRCRESKPDLTRPASRAVAGSRFCCVAGPTLSRALVLRFLDRHDGDVARARSPLQRPRARWEFRQYLRHAAPLQNHPDTPAARGLGEQRIV